MSVLKVLSELDVDGFEVVEVILIDTSHIPVKGSFEMYLIRLEHLPILFCQ
jgi:hypothetical protein